MVRPKAASPVHGSGGVPRVVNQLSLQALIHAVVHGVDEVDGALMKRVLHAHPLFGQAA